MIEQLESQKAQEERDEGRFPALRSRAYRLLWIGLTVSAIGTRMQDATARWHVYDLTHSVVALGLIGLFRFLPLVLFSLIGGAIADTFDRRTVLLVTQSTLAIGAALLAAVTQLGIVSAPIIYAVNALSAAALAFDSPARQALIPNLVPRRHFANAASLNSTAIQLATIIGPCLAGLLLQRNAFALIYALNALSFVAVLIALVWMGPVVAEPKSASTPIINGTVLLEGFRYVRTQPILFWTMGLDFLATFFSSAEALLPVFARDILHVRAAGYGLLSAAAAFGSVTAAAALAYRRTIARQGPTILVAVFVYGAATVLFGVSRSFWLSMAALAISGASDTISTILRQTVRQMNTPDGLRGRMTAFNMIFFIGGPQLGNLEAGLLAGMVGAPWSVISGGLACIVSVAWVASRAKALRSYGSHEAD